MQITEKLRQHDGLLSIDKLAKMLGVSYQTVYDQVVNQTIPFMRIGKLYKFDPTAIAEWMEQKSHKLDEKQLEAWLNDRGIMLNTDQISRVWAVLSEEV